MKLTIDIETFSRQDLKKGGMARYAEHPSTDILCVCWAFDDEPVSAWVPSADEEFGQEVKKNREGLEDLWIGPQVPPYLVRHIEAGGEIHAWNAAFERSVLNGSAGKRYKFPHIEIAQTRCSMASARVHGLPGSLEDAANAVASPVKKRLTGVNQMRYLCKPRKDGTRPLIAEERERFLQLIPYCADDVRAERAVDKIVPAISELEQRIYELDQQINDAGVLIDLELVDNMEVLISIYKKELDARCRTLTGIKPSRPGPLATWIRQHGFPELENLQADTVRKALKLDIGEDAKTVLKTYSTFNAKSVMKYAAMRQAVCSDARVRHMFMFYGAATGRWSSTIVQLQNLARPSIADPEIAIEASKEWDLDWIRTLYPGVDPMKIFGTCVRGALTAAPGCELVFPDFAGIEARYNAWMWGEEWKLQAYRDYDKGMGANLYCIIYGRCFGVDPASPEGIAGKPVGKVLDLSMQYEGGVGAHVKMAAAYRVDLKDMAAKTILPPDVRDEAIEHYHYAEEQGRLYDLPQDIWVASEGQKLLWRRAHPSTVAGWAELKGLAIKATENAGVIFRTRNARLMFKVEDRWLILRLPSGRKLWYYQPQVREDAKGRQTLHYQGINTKTRQWGLTSIYGGAWCLAAGTIVLTDIGWRRIEDCSSLNALWDGIEWVYSGGLVAQGVRLVIEYLGVRMTHDHEVLTDEGWKTAAVAQSQGFDGAHVRLPEDHGLCGQSEWKDALARQVPVRDRVRGGGSRLDTGARPDPSLLRLPNEQLDECTANKTRNEPASRHDRVAQYARSLHQTFESRLEKLRRSRNTSLRTLADLRKFLAGYGRLLLQRAYSGANEQLAGVSEVELQVGDPCRAGKQQTLEPAYWRTDRGAGSKESRAEPLDCVRAHSSRMAQTRMAETYDLIDSGPRHRFTVLSDKGPLLVHNCNNETQGGCRDLLTRAMLRMQERGLKLIGSVHDEPLLEVPIGSVSDQDITAMMCADQTWDAGLPLAVEVHRGARYRK